MEQIIKIKITDERLTNESVIYEGSSFEEIKLNLKKDLKKINFELPEDLEFEIIEEQVKIYPEHDVKLLSKKNNWRQIYENILVHKFRQPCWADIYG